MARGFGSHFFSDEQEGMFISHSASLFLTRRKEGKKEVGTDGVGKWARSCC